MAETFASSAPDQRMLAALAASDQATAVLRETLTAISAAEEQILSNIRNADTTGLQMHALHSDRWKAAQTRRCIDG